MTLKYSKRQKLISNKDKTIWPTQIARFFDNSFKILKIHTHHSYYKKLIFQLLETGIPINDTIRILFPFLLRNSLHPLQVSIELTNHCNLRCLYCPNSLISQKKGFMSDKVFEKVIEDLSYIKTNRIRLVGCGESTLHPKFYEHIKVLAIKHKHFTIITNGQWNRDEIPYELLTAPVNLIEISIDAGGKKGYERTRINGSYAKLIENIKKLHELKKQLKSNTIISIMLMLRPSQIKMFKDEFKFWIKYADAVLPQNIVKINNNTYDDDVFHPIQNRENSIPICKTPFIGFEVLFNGNVLLCSYSKYQIGYPGLIIGNVLDKRISELWNCKIMNTYRKAHRKRIKELMSICTGCPGS